MSVVIFILVLIALIVVHELGHFFAAKWAGMKVEEFGLGYPPRAWTFWRKNGTEYTLNWLPFGGFVKIQGEDGENGNAVRSGQISVGDSFDAKPRIVQALVLVAGIAMNLVFAWVLISGTLALGMPRALTDAEALDAPDARLAISRVMKGSPADAAGVAVGDYITRIAAGEEVYEGASAESFTSFVVAHGEHPLTLHVRRGGETLALSMTPARGIIEGERERAALGIGVAPVGTVPVPLWKAPWEGALLTYEATKQVGAGLVAFFAGVFTLSADFAQVSGPVGIAGAVGDASASGLVALLSLTAIISINLALINLLPVPALDGGRLLFVAIEAVIHRPLPASVAGSLNMAGFAFLILLMVAVTASDIWKLLS